MSGEQHFLFENGFIEVWLTYNRLHILEFDKFWHVIMCYPFWVFMSAFFTLYVMYLFYLDAFNIFFFSLIFEYFDDKIPWCHLLWFIELGVFELLIFAGFHQVWKILSHYYLTIIFCLPLSALSGHLPHTCIGKIFHCLPMVCFVSVLFLFCFILHHFYGYESKFTNVFLHI